MRVKVDYETVYDVLYDRCDVERDMLADMVQQPDLFDRDDIESHLIDLASFVLCLKMLDDSVFVLCEYELVYDFSYESLGEKSPRPHKNNK